MAHQRSAKECAMSSLATLEARAPVSERPSRLVVEPTTPVIGAEISGVDLSRPLDEATRDEIHRALLRWRVLFFRDQDLTNDQLPRRLRWKLPSRARPAPARRPLPPRA